MTPVAGPAPPAGSQGHWSQVVAAAVILVVAAGVYVAFPAGGTSRAPSVPLGRSLPASTCEQLLPNATLDQEVAGIYAGLPSIGNLSLGPNQTEPKGLGAYPPEAAAEAWAVGVWTAVCGSPTFGGAYASTSGVGFGYGLELNFSSGDYELSFIQAWSTSCPAPGGQGTVACTLDATWTGDIVTGSVQGPAISGPVVPTCCPAALRPALPSGAG